MLYVVSLHRSDIESDKFLAICSNPKIVLAQPEIPERIAYARKPRRLPVVLSADEVVRFLEAVPSLKSRTALTTAYAAGLRVSEVVMLKIADIDSGRMMIRVEQGKRPFGGPKQILAYLGRYTHRVAIANSRLLEIEDGRVRFRWKDDRHHDKQKVMALDAGEFSRRFLPHVLPDGFHRIRHYGFLANGRRTAKLERCWRLLAASRPEPPAEPDGEVNTLPKVLHPMPDMQNGDAVGDRLIEDEYPSSRRHVDCSGSRG